MKLFVLICDRLGLALERVKKENMTKSYISDKVGGGISLPNTLHVHADCSKSSKPAGSEVRSEKSKRNYFAVESIETLPTSPHLRESGSS